MRISIEASRISLKYGLGRLKVALLLAHDGFLFCSTHSSTSEGQTRSSITIISTGQKDHSRHYLSLALDAIDDIAAMTPAAGNEKTTMVWPTRHGMGCDLDSEASRLLPSEVRSRTSGPGTIKRPVTLR